MAEETDDSQKTEEPTRKRLEEAAKRGQIASSREVSSFFILLAFTLLLVWILPGLSKKTMGMMTRFLSDAESIEMDQGNLGDLMIETVIDMALIAAVPFALLAVAAIFSNLIQSKMVFSADPIMPRLDKLSPLKGFGRIFSRRSLVEFIKGIIKITIVGTIAFAAVWPYLHFMQVMPNEDIKDVLAFLMTMAERMLIGVCIAMFFIAILDFVYQYFEYIRSLRMTKQEVRDEYKQQEGDPMVKQRLRSIRMERARQRMMSAVPKADVVITNPTHFAVALKYDSGAMAAPTVVAKGMDFIAQQIRKLAEQNEVPIIENAPLARALFDSVEIGQEIPYEHYKAVAEVISAIYRMKGKLPPQRAQATAS